MRHNVAMSLRTVTATRYVTPLREGGSLPAVIEADDDGLYVLKFRGAGQGTKALIAELVAGELARAAGLPIPEIVFVQLDAELGRSEPDAEIQRLIRTSAGINLALDYLPGSVTFDPLVERIGDDLASALVWFDAFITNVDRTARNANLLMWHRWLWLIDHGAALYFHHNWSTWLDSSRKPFPLISNHVLLPFASELEAADARMSAAITPGVVDRIVSLIPEDWLIDDPLFADAQAQRQAYGEYLTDRLQTPRLFFEEAVRAHSTR